MGRSEFRSEHTGGDGKWAVGDTSIELRGEVWGKGRNLSPVFKWYLKPRD